ncbi:histidine kinase [Streptomyces sp. NPDC051907]|uniref:sensor histidine kinase n=1 Tax=Streptomyces sp. NPDC051907 TaxID=3155284 RepID=UPI00343A8322
MERTEPSRLGDRVVAALTRDPSQAPHAVRNDAVLAAVLSAVAAFLAFTLWDDGRRPDALGWVLLLGAHVPLAWRRRRPMLVVVLVLACVVPYHALDNMHLAPIPVSMIALYTVGATGRPLRTVLVGVFVVTMTVIIQLTSSPHEAVEALRISGWIAAVLFFGMDVRLYRQYVASIVERAERAERTREEEAARRVAEERLRIARDLHDLLAHSITLIGVQTSVAAHILAVDPDRLDRAAVAKALDDIAETCRTARGELRTTLEVLRTDAPGVDGPLPDLASLPDLVRSANADLSVRTGDARLPPAVEAAAYRIVQESLTNAVRHGGPSVRIRVEVRLRDEALAVTVADDGEAALGGTGGSGYGIVGMRERARSVGGTLSAGPREDGGFTVAATLPLQPTEALA